MGLDEHIYRPIHFLVGGWTNPSEKNARQIGSFPQVGVKIKHIWNQHPVLVDAYVVHVGKYTP